MAKKPRNRAAQDVTLINLRALKARVRILEIQLAGSYRVADATRMFYQTQLEEVAKRVAKLEQRSPIRKLKT